MRKILLPTAILALVAGACSDVARTEGSKAALFPEVVKNGPPLAVRSAQRATALALHPAEDALPVLRPGESAEGVLDEADPGLADGSRFEAWTLELAEAGEVSVSMTSSEVDAVLSLHEGEPGRLGALVAMNDDAGPGRAARVTVALARGEYTIVAGTFSSGETGVYGLEVEARSGDSAATPRLTTGQLHGGELTPSDAIFADGSHFDAWSYRGREGERLTVTMRTSEFDPFLLLFAGEVEEGRLLAEDDDGGRGSDARLALTLPATGTYTVATGSSSELETGAYEVSVQSAGAAEIHFDNAGISSERYALLVGIDDYPGTASDLEGPVRDARVMRDLLLDRFGFEERNVVLLTDSEATRANIANAMLAHLGQAGSDGMAVFFFSGHGIRTPDIGLTTPLDPDPTGDEALLVHGHPEESTVLLEEELGYLVEGIGAGRTLVILDAGTGSGPAPSGDLRSKGRAADDPDTAATLRLPLDFVAVQPGVSAELAGLEVDPEALGRYPEALRRTARYVVWRGSGAGRPAWIDRGAGGSSVFTHHLARHLAGADSMTTLADLAGAVSTDVRGHLAEFGVEAEGPSMSGGDLASTLEEFFRRR